MVNIIIQKEETVQCAERIMEQYGADKRDPAIREAAYSTAALQQEAIKQAEKRRYYR